MIAVRRGQQGRNLGADPDPTRLGHRFESRHGLPDELDWIVRLELHRKAASLDARDILEVVYELPHALRSPTDRVGPLSHERLFLARSAPRQGGCTHRDRAKRVPQIVRDDGQDLLSVAEGLALLGDVQADTLEPTRSSPLVLRWIPVRSHMTAPSRRTNR